MFCLSEPPPIQGVDAVETLPMPEVSELVIEDPPVYQHEFNEEMDRLLRAKTLIWGEVEDEQEDKVAAGDEKPLEPALEPCQDDEDCPC